MRQRPCRQRHIHRQSGVVTLEYAFLLIIALIPLLLFTFTGTLIFAAKQSLTLAAAEGSRAALHYGNTSQRQQSACLAARRSMQWLLNFSGQNPNCSSPAGAPIQVSGAYPCESGSSVNCMRVTVSYNYDQHPFIPGTGAMYGWTIGRPLTSQAVVQLGNSSP